MPRWFLPIVILISLYVLSVGPLVTYFSKHSKGATMVPTWLRSYGSPYLWVYGQSPKPVQEISDGYFRWCKDMLAKSAEEAELMKKQGVPQGPLPMGR